MASDRTSSLVTGTVVLGVAAALAYGGLRLDDVVTTVTVVAVGVAVAVLAGSLYRWNSILFAVAMFGIAVALTAVGFAVGTALGLTAAAAGLVAAVFGFVAFARSNYGIFAYALAGLVVNTAALGVHFLRADATLLAVTLLGVALASLVVGAAMLRMGVDW
jgi:hypothetical protein